MKRVYIDDDDFVWHCLTSAEAQYYLDCALPVHVVNEQGDRQIHLGYEIRDAIRRGDMVATPVGFMNDIEN